MSGKLHRSEGVLPIFADVHLKDRDNRLHVEVTFAVDPHIEQLAGAFYMDGSASMQQAGNYGRKRSLFMINLGEQRNQVEEAMRVIVPYIAQKDADGVCRVAYWATGSSGREIEPIGELDAARAAVAEFDGPRKFGNSTYLLPAVRDFVDYIQQVQGQSEVKAALGAFVTDGQLHDFEDVMAYTGDLARAIMAGKFPRTSLVLVGVGPAADHEQMEELSEATPEGYTGRDIWCCAEAESVEDLPELVAHLLDSNIPAFWGGAVLKDERGRTVAAWEDMVPAVIEFELADGAKSFTLQVAGQDYTQPLIGLEEHH